MARGYRRKRRRSNRRRRARSNRAKIARIAVNAVNAQQSGKHVYKKNIRGTAVSTSEDQVSWSVLCDFHCSSVGDFPIKTAIEDTGAQSGAAIGDADNVFTNFAIRKGRACYHIRNLSPHPCFMTLYEITPKVHIELLASGAATLKEHLIDMIAEGWKELAGAGSAGLTSATGDANITQNAFSIQTRSNNLNLSDSPYYKQYYKVLRKKSYKLNAGDDVYWNMSFPNFTFHPRFYLPSTQNSLTGTERDKEGIKSMSRILLMKMHGALGKDATTTSEVGYMTCDLGGECSYSVELRENIKHDPRGLSINSTFDDLTGHALTGPTEFVAEVTDDD